MAQLTHELSNLSMSWKATNNESDMGRLTRMVEHEHGLHVSQETSISAGRPIYFIDTANRNLGFDGEELAKILFGLGTLSSPPSCAR